MYTCRIFMLVDKLPSPLLQGWENGLPLTEWEIELYVSFFCGWLVLYFTFFIAMFSKTPPSFTIHPLRSSPDGSASLPCPLSILCSEWGAVLPALPEVRRYGPGRALQHCQLCPAHLHDCTHHRPKGELLSEDVVIANVIN